MGRTLVAVGHKRHCLFESVMQSKSNKCIMHIDMPPPRRHLARSRGGRRVREEPTIEWTCRFSFRHRTSEPITVVGSSDAVLCKTPLVRLDKSSFLSGRYLRRRYNNAGMVAIRIRNGAIFPSRKSRNGECINSTVVLSHSPTWSTRSHAAALHRSPLRFLHSESD